MNPVPQLLTVDETAALLKVPRSWLYGRHHEQKLPFAPIKCGHYLRFRLADVEAFIQKQLPAGANGGGSQ